MKKTHFRFVFLVSRWFISYMSSSSSQLQLVACFFTLAFPSLAMISSARVDIFRLIFLKIQKKNACNIIKGTMDELSMYSLCLFFTLENKYNWPTLA